MKFSIRKRLMWAFFLAIVGLSTMASIATYLQARSDINEHFDYEIRQMAITLSMHLSAHPSITDEPLLRVEHDFVTQVWRDEKQLLVSSSPGRGPDRLLPRGLSNFGGSNDGWRTFTVEAGEVLVQVAQPQSLRRRMATNIAAKALIPILAIVPIGGLIIWLLVGYGLKPLRKIAEEIESRDPTSLSLIELKTLPVEAVPLIQSLNDLLGRLARASKLERQFIADASHELKTPITALRLQLELLETASNTDEREESIRDLRRGVERINRLIEQILTLARLDPDNTGKTPWIDLAAFVTDIREDYEHIAASKSIRFKVCAKENFSVQGDFASLNALVCNTLDNAMRYTPAGGDVTLQLGKTCGVPQIQITDSGPGIPQEIREKVFSRFFRANHDSDTTGAGLGLAIARRAAERLGAHLELRDRAQGNGLAVLISFPNSPVKARSDMQQIPVAPS